MNDTIELRESKFSEKAFIEFASEQIDKFKQHAEIIKNPENITLSDLNQALSEYSIVKSTLLLLLAMAEIEYNKYEEEFEDWLSHKFVIIRSRENRENLPAQKWLGQKEIERIIRVEFNFEYKGLKERMSMTEIKKKHLSRMVDAWISHQHIIGQLSKNIQAEIMIGNSKLSREIE